MPKNASSVRGYVLVLLSALCYGSYGIWSRWLSHDFGDFYQAGVRAAIGLIILVPIMLFTRQMRRAPSSGRLWLIVCIVFGLFTSVPIYYAFNHLAIGTTNILFYATYLASSFFIGIILIGEQLTLAKLAAAGLALVGLVLVFGVSLSSFSVLGMLLAMVSGLATGGQVATTKKLTAVGYPTIMVSLWTWVAALVVDVPAAAIVHERLVLPSLDRSWLIMIGYAVAGLAGFWLVVEGYKFISASIGSLVGLAEILFAIAVGAIFFGESLTLSIVVGGVLILVAAALPDIVSLMRISNKTVVADT